ncbi:MAG: ABC transporter permease [Verrucomicrobia bacterium]|nr:ABC transporter permease [Cytophagales bacterium]
MLRNYFKIGWRNIVKNSLYSVVNVTGLLAGITFAVLIGAYVWGERQINTKLRHSNQQYILTSLWKDPNMGLEFTTLAPLSKRLKEDYPNLIANYYRWDGLTSGITKGDKHFREQIQLGDSTLLSMFGFELLHGNAGTALLNPYSVVITAEKAIKYFNRTDVIGETLVIQNFSGGKRDFMVTGVLKEIPENSVTQIKASIKNTFFIPTNTFSYFGRSSFDNWENTVLPSYIELKEGVSISDLEKPLQQLIRQNTPETISQNLKIRPVALTDYYLQKDNGLVKRMLYTLSCVGMFILLMAIINFINLAISRSGTRIREIGVRKVLGGLRRQLIFQFLTESVILVLMATVLSVILYPALRPLFEQLVGKSVPMLSSFPVYFALLPLAIVLIVGLLAGLYPAFVLSSLNTVDSLKGKLKTANQKIWLRKWLVGFQFCMANVVLIAATVVTQQVDYFFSQSLGYNKEYVVSSQVPRDWSAAGVQKMETVRNQFAAMSQISSVSLSHEIPNGNNGGQPLVYRKENDSTQAIPMQAMISDENYLNTYQITLKAGNFFDSRGLDSGKIVINEKATQVLGYKNIEEAIDRQIRIPGDPTVFVIKGIVQDFHFNSMQQPIQPTIFFSVKGVPIYRYLSFKIKPGNVAQTIEAIQKKWAVLLPGSSFEYTFMDDTLKQMYSTEIQLKKAAYVSALLALIIALLGVLGLVSVSVHKRVKEIGVRKVLGASLPDILLLFIKEFVFVMIIAAAVACPLAYFMMQSWLNHYAYRIDLTPQPFIISIVGLSMLTSLLISFQAIKTALANPVKSLRTE